MAAEIVFFVIASLCAVGGAVGVAAVRNPFYSVLALVFHLISLAALFLLAHAQFVAAAQIVVYAGAVMVLYVFVVAYVGGQDEPLGGAGGPLAKGGAVVFAAALLAELLIAVVGSGLQALSSGGPPLPGPDFGSPAQIGRLLLTRFLFVFEAASFLLLVAAVGAVVLAKRRGAGTHSLEEQRVSVMDVLRPQGTGTMLEGVTGLTGTPAHRPVGPPASDTDADGGERGGEREDGDAGERGDDRERAGSASGPEAGGW